MKPRWASLASWPAWAAASTIRCPARRPQAERPLPGGADYALVARFTARW